MNADKSVCESSCYGSQTMCNIVQIQGYQERIQYIDSVKGFAIILMIFGHMRFHNLNWFIYSFHMPLFFILSGFFFNPRKSISKRIKKLMIPYLITSLVILGMEVIFQFLKKISHNEVFSLIEIINNMAAAVCVCAKPVGIGNYLIPDVGPIWFLMALAIGYGILWALNVLESKYNIDNMTIISCMILAILGWIISLHRGQIPFSINQAMIVPLFLWIGGEIRRKLSHNRALLLLAVIVWGIQLYIQKYVQFMSMGQMGSIYFPIYIVGAIAASYLTIAIFKGLNSRFKFHIINILGTATLMILCIHTIDLFGIEPRLHYFLSNIRVEDGKLIAFMFSYKIFLYGFLLFYVVRKHKKHGLFLVRKF